MKPFVVSPTVTFPANAATSTFAFLGTRASGKTYGAGVFVEQLLAQSVQTVVVDPVGSWYALRLDADGKHAGFAIPVFGGIHGDVPLEATGGELVAQLIVERRMSCVLDVSDFTDGQQHRFVTDLAREIFRLKRRSPSPLHMVFEEGHEFFPQFVDAASAPMVGATKRLWKVGRNYGIGGTIISQRAAEVNKSALNLSDRIVTGQLKAPEDIKRIDGWANSNGVSDDMVAELPRLPKGTLIVWEETGAVRSVFNKKRTFDASRTPDGTDVKAAKLSPIDLDAVRTAMAATIEEVKSNDPKALKARIVELERELANRTKAPAASPAKVIEKPVVMAKDLTRIEKLADRCRKLDAEIIAATNLLAQRYHEVAALLGPLEARVRQLNQREEPAAKIRGASTGAQWPIVTKDDLKAAASVRRDLATGRPVRIPTPLSAALVSDEHLPDKSQRMLGALRQGEAMKRSSMPFRNVAVIAGVAPTSGTTRNRKGQLVRLGLITVHGDNVQLTDAGRAYPIDVEMPPDDPEKLLEFWKREIGTEKVAAILETVVRQGPISDQALADAVGMERSGTFRNYKGELTRRGLIEKRGDGYAATEVFRR